uniref:Putative secreted peptide n=1 Tax=Anopheles braziliensis TaxID=58242 RepID=A0A2M3ZV25_9DIPT
MWVLLSIGTLSTRPSGLRCFSCVLLLREYHPHVHAVELWASTLIQRHPVTHVGLLGNILMRTLFAWY